ncbi:MAG: hypothetical protein DRQ24_11915 [Candidatus Latescibacterota bacterium]|nr:MAG: hypothetical protein DRQ24_11915 [Candidatus Latescibacterota bacterium]
MVESRRDKAYRINNNNYVGWFMDSIIESDIPTDMFSKDMFRKVDEIVWEHSRLGHEFVIDINKKLEELGVTLIYLGGE